MAEYIERAAAMRAITKLFEPVETTEEAQILNILLSVLNAQPAAPVIEVRPELRRAVEMLDDAYKHAIEQPFIRNPLAYALYQVWKVTDEKGREV